MTKEQVISDNYAIYNSDCMEVIKELPDESIDLSVFSPPFADLYTYSSDHRDMSNVESVEQFLNQFEYLVKELSRVTKKGRINALHVTDICDVSGTLLDFPHMIINLFKKHGFEFKNRVTVWKEPLKVRIRTMVQSLMHKYIVEDSTKCFPANPDYILIFKKKGESETPVTHPCGINHYAGETLILPNILKAWNNKYKTNLNELELEEHLKSINEDDKITKYNHVVWQRYASSTWDDVRDNIVLEYKKSKEEEDEKHVTPTQLDVIDRLVELYSNEKETILTPFMGIGTEVYSAVSMNRKAIGIELKDSYFKQAKINLKHAENRFKNKVKQEQLF